MRRKHLIRPVIWLKLVGLIRRVSVASGNTSLMADARPTIWHELVGLIRRVSVVSGSASLMADAV
ncbi:hypothetical protein OM226_15990 [Escherichia albertii]|nr:hypothetical protein [Escherichia albertii]